MQQFTLSSYSTALFSTWHFLEELGLLFDAGDGLMANLLQKSRKIKHVFLSHPDRDHITGLFQFLQLNAREDFPVVYYPRDSGSFPALQNFISAFDPHVHSTKWVPIGHGDKVFIRDDYYVEAFRNNHIPCPQDVQKSLGFILVQRRQKLKQEFKNLSGKDIKERIATLGKEATHDKVYEKILGYSGDTPLENFEQWKDCKVLIHEATFLDGDQLPVHGEKHSHLQGVLERCSALNLGALVLSHFSTRYDANVIDEQILTYCETYSVPFPVHRILPGKTHWNLLAERPVFNGI